MMEKVNIHWQNDVCSHICKYAYLSVGQANCLGHIPQKVHNYCNTKNCNEDEGVILEAAEAYYIKLYGQPSEEEYQQQYHNNETWQDARNRLREEYEELMQRTTAYFYENYNRDEPEGLAYLDEMNEAFILNRDEIINGIQRILDLSAHKSHKGQSINLCHDCWMVYDNEDLITIGKKVLCKFIKGRNENPCHKEEAPENDKENIDPKILEEYLHK